MVCVDPCAADPCENNARCVSEIDSDDVIGFYCECLPGFTGAFCQDGKAFLDFAFIRLVVTFSFNNNAPP